MPADQLMGALNGGWAITQGSLAHERAMLWIGSTTSLQRSVAALVELADRPGTDGRR